MKIVWNQYDTNKLYAPGKGFFYSRTAVGKSYKLS